MSESSLIVDVLDSLLIGRCAFCMLRTIKNIIEIQLGFFLESLIHHCKSGHKNGHLSGVERRLFCKACRDTTKHLAAFEYL